MLSSERVLVGRPAAWNRPAVWLCLAVACFLGTFAAYAVGVFHIAGGVIFIPGEAALVGLVAATLVGLARGGAVPGWLLAAASLYGYRADHAFLGLSGRTLAEQTAYFLGVEGLVVLAVQGVVIGTLAVAVGALARAGMDAVSEAATA
ncbi:hypothetical protein [Halorarius halobius]|uniref:hypothetical protein n=1 Tax=Halorarius halobius TaxID=2962671 RepID=UPI0020CC0064|nr:hypothetical protein [Halorarius halobius]